jgi:hypothetical protein
MKPLQTYTRKLLLSAVAMLFVLMAGALSASACWYDPEKPVVCKGIYCGKIP